MLVFQKDPARVELFSILTLTFLFVRITYKEVNSGNHTETRIESSRYMSTTVHRHWGRQLFWYLPYQLDITSLSRNFVYSCVQGFCQVHFTILLQIQHENNFLATSEHRQAKFRRHLSICLYYCYIYETNFVFRKCLEARRHLGSGRKTVNRDLKIGTATAEKTSLKKWIRVLPILIAITPSHLLCQM